MLVIPHTYRWDGYVFHQYAGENKASVLEKMAFYPSYLIST